MLQWSISLSGIETSNQQNTIMIGLASCLLIVNMLFVICRCRQSLKDWYTKFTFLCDEGMAHRSQAESDRSFVAILD